MPINVIHSFLVHPLKGLEARDIRGACLSHNGALFLLLRRIYERASEECDVDICFSRDESGRQVNECRNLMLEYLRESTIQTARLIASRLESSTDRRSGLGLLFIIYGTEGDNHKLVLSRFPTDEGIAADESGDGLNVQYIERVFLKNKHTYKSVVYQDRSVRNGFWIGRAIDRQGSDPRLTFATNYWITDFLQSELSVTPAAGTRRLAGAIKKAIDKSDAPIRRELVAAATLATGLRGQSISISAMAQRFNLSQAATGAVIDELRTPHAADERFRFDEEEFVSAVGLLSVELDNRATITAPSADFDRIIHRREIRGTPNTEFITRGVVVEEKLKKLR